ncbi:MAG: hypothetical protein GX911_07090 [Spirochaetales bacterium]|nr:hypothetical protein [Spirochaetales bacterium]
MIECYAFVRYNGPVLTLTPFLREGHDLLGDQAVMYTGGMLNAQQKDQATFALFSQIDFAVDRWIQDKRYVPRLLFSALAFMLSYLFFSLVVRDPLPMIDELLISGALAIFVWVSLARRDTRSILAQENRQRLKMVGGKRTEQIREDLFSIDEHLDATAKTDAKELARQIVEGTLPKWAVAIEASERILIRTLLDRYLAVYEKPTFRWIRRLDRSGKNLATKLYIQGSEGSVDLSLLALRCALKRSEE